MKKRVIFAIISTMILIAIPVQKSIDDENNALIHLNNMNIERAIRHKIDKPYGDLLGKDVKKIETLKIESMAVENISDINKLPNLEKLVLINTGTHNFRFLNSDSLKILDISKNNIKDADIENLSDLKNLEELYISYNKISNISPLTKLKNLKIIFADHNSIDDFTTLERLKKLEKLVVSGNDVDSDIKLPDLKNVEVVNEIDTTYEDIERQKNEIYGIDDEITYNQDVFREELYKQKNYNANDISDSDEEIQVMDLNFFVESTETIRENYDRKYLLEKKEELKEQAKRTDLNELITVNFDSAVSTYQMFEEIMYENPDFNKMQIAVDYDNCVYYDDQDTPVTIAVPRFAEIEKVQYENCSDWCEYED
jgi:hypothetical protein